MVSIQRQRQTVKERDSTTQEKRRRRLNRLPSQMYKKERERETATDRQTDRQTDRDRVTERDRARETETETERHIQTGGGGYQIGQKYTPSAETTKTVPGIKTVG